MSKLLKCAIGLSIAFIIFIGLAAVLFFTAINVKDIKDDVLGNNGVIFAKNVVKEIDEEKQESLENINLIKLDISFGDVYVKKSEDEIFRAIVKGKLVDMSCPSRDLKINLIKDGGTLKFKLSQNWKFGISVGNYFEGDITLEVPQSYKGDLDIDISSGKIDMFVENTLNNLKINVSSGSLIIDSIVSAKTRIDISSGHINIGKLITGEVNIDISSGNLTIDNCIATDIKTEASSGTIDLKGTFKTLKANISSGTVNIEAKELNGNYNIDISSGRFFLKLPQNASYTMEGEISSGSIKNNVTDKRYIKDFAADVNGGGYKIKFDISSGYVEIN